MNDIRNIAFTKDQINKIGNAIIYFSLKVPALDKTKILQLLFVTEEACIKKFGHPFFNIEFQLWKLGPITKDIYIDLSEEDPILLEDFIKRYLINPGNFVAKAEFTDDEFSDNDIELMDLIIKLANYKDAKILANLQNENSLWRKSAIQYGVLDLLEKGRIHSTEYTVDFNLLFNNTPEHLYLKERYESSKENLQFVKHLKR